MTFAYWCILIACLLPLFCAAYAKAGGFRFKDNHNPRGFLAHTQGAAARAHAAQQNGFEAFAPFAAAVLTAHATGNAAQSTINTLACLFILFRLAFILVLYRRQSRYALTDVGRRICLHRRAVCRGCLKQMPSENTNVNFSDGIENKSSKIGEFLCLQDS